MPLGMRTLLRAACGLSLTLVTGCPEGPRYPATWKTHAPDEPGAPPPAPAHAPAAPVAAPRPSEAAAMHAWFRAIGSAEHAVVAGDVAAAREEGRGLADRLHASVPPGTWVAIVAEITREADALARAESLGHAAMSVARLAHGCGDCHASLGVRPALPDMGAMPARPAPGDRAAAMRWHGWAAERMWEGLVGPSDDRWVRGTATFVELPGCEEGTERCRVTRALAQRAHVTPAPDARAEIYGKLLATCADCHVASRGPFSAASSSAPSPRRPYLAEGAANPAATDGRDRRDTPGA